jgi:hypothetical protein
MGRSWNELRFLAADRQKWKELIDNLFLKEQLLLLYFTEYSLAFCISLYFQIPYFEYSVNDVDQGEECEGSVRHKHVLEIKVI